MAELIANQSVTAAEHVVDAQVEIKTEIRDFDTTNFQIFPPTVLDQIFE
jgi:hypothetical protein